MTKKNRNFANNIKESSMRVKKTLWLFATLILFCGMPVNAQDTEEYKPFFHTSELPDLLKWLPAPPDSTSEAFVHDIMRYMWGKTQRLDSVRAAIAKRDAIWQSMSIAVLLVCGYPRRRPQRFTNSSYGVSRPVIRQVVKPSVSISANVPSW